MVCTWLIDVLSDTVDERTPAPVEVGSLSHYLQYIPGGAGFLPPTCRFEVIVRPSRCSLSAGSVDPKPVRFTRGGHDVQSDTMIKHQVLPIHPCRGRYDTEGRIYNCSFWRANGCKETAHQPKPFGSLHLFLLLGGDAFV